MFGKSRYRPVSDLTGLLIDVPSFPPQLSPQLSPAFPTSDIVQAILDGREPSGLSLAKLAQPLPIDWDEQRAQLGFTG